MLATTNPPHGRLDPVSKWLYLTRAGVLPMTLVAAALAGLLAVFRDASVDWGWFALAALGIVLAHMANNLMNDLFDLEVGTDTADYPRNLYSPHPVISGVDHAQGPRRVRARRQRDLPRDHDRAHRRRVAGRSIAFALGGFLLSAAYTAPPLRLKKHGLGEPTVIVVWGPLMVGGVYYAATGSIPGAVVLASLPYAILCTTVLMGKHIDKIPWDAADGTHTLPVILGEARARRVTRGMFVVFYLSVIALVIGQVLPVAHHPRAGVAPDDAAHVAGVLRAEARGIARVPNPVWPLWFAPHVVPPDPAGRRPPRARDDPRRRRRLVTAADRDARERSRRGDRRDLALALTGRSRSAARSCSAAPLRANDLAPSVALGIRFTWPASSCWSCSPRCARRCSRPPASACRVLGLGLCIYTVESTFFYLGLERGTAAAVALIFYLYPAVIALVETVTGTIRLRAGTARRARTVGLRQRHGRDRRRRVAISATGVLFVLRLGRDVLHVRVADHRVIPRTDSLTAGGVDRDRRGGRCHARSGSGSGRCTVPSGGALAAIGRATASATAVAFTLFFVVLDRLGPSRTASCMALEAVFGVVLSAVFLGERVRPVVVDRRGRDPGGRGAGALVSPAPIEAVERSSTPVGIGCGISPPAGARIEILSAEVYGPICRTPSLPARCRTSR